MSVRACRFKSCLGYHFLSYTLSCVREGKTIFLKKKYTEVELREIVKNSYSYAQVLRKLGIKTCGGNYSCVKSRINKCKIDTSHFTGKGHYKGKTKGYKRDIEDYLNNKYPIQSYKLKLRLLKEKKLLPICNMCKLSSWLNVNIPLELHHKNGINTDNNLNNLELLCPNCHALTDSYRGKNKKT